MEKKREVKKGAESHHFMDKLLMKLKMTKHAGEEKPSGSGSVKKNKDSDTLASCNSKPLITWEKSRVNPENIMEFSDQLHQLLEYVQNLKDIVFYTYEYPNKLNERLEKEAIELRNLFREIRAAAIDIDRLQKHRFLIKKEKCLASQKLDKLKDDEMRELESIICAYSKPLHSKWEAIKNCQKVDVLENFMNEVTGKHRAIEILQELVKRKLAKLSKKNTAVPINLKKNISSTNMRNKFKNQDKNTGTWNVTPFSDLEKFNQTSDKLVRGSTDREILRMSRRKRQKELREERRRQNQDNSAGSNNPESSGGLDLQLVPIENFPSEESDDIVAMSKLPTSTGANLSSRTPIINIEFTSDDDSVSLSSSDLAIENFAQSGNTEAPSDLQNEMRNVLQALFGEIRQLPQIANFSSRNRHNNSGNDLRSSRTASH